MTTHPGDQSSSVPDGLVFQDDVEEQVLQEPLAYSDFNSTDGCEDDEQDEKTEVIPETVSPPKNLDLVLRTRSFHSDLNLLQHTGLSRNEYTSIWTRIGSTHDCSELSLGEALHGTGDRKTYTYTKPIVQPNAPHSESERVAHQSEVPRHSGILGVTRIPIQLADLEIMIQLGYSFTMQNDRFEIAHALTQEAVNEIVESTDKMRATSAQQQHADWRLTTLTVVVIIHHGPELGQNLKVVSLKAVGSEASHDSAVAALESSHPGQTRTHIEGLTSVNNPSIRRIPNSRSLAGTSISGFHTSRSIMSKNSYKTASGGPDLRDVARRQLQENSQYAQMLRSRDLWPANSATEQDWSGRGQHVEFTKSDYGFINDILQVQGILGSTTGTIVESVRCRRILLARKTITCNRRFTKEQAIEEVAHITRLSHAHILQVIGTYVVGKNLSILLYPVARYNLDEFLETLISASTGRRQWIAMVNSCRTFFACLSEAISYIHSTFTKHLDIKPHNILVRKNLKPSRSILEYTHSFIIYIADFGVSRSYPREDLIETDGQVCFTRKYAAPEVVSLDKRGLPADIFSLGCVFLEMYIALCDASTGIAFYNNLANLQSSGAGYDKLTQLRRQDRLHTTHTRRLQSRLETSTKDNSYQANLDILNEHYLTILTESHTSNARPSGEKISADFTGALRLLIAAMMSFSPRERPTAAVLRTLFLQNTCCGNGPCQLEAMVSDSEEGGDSDEG